MKALRLAFISGLLLISSAWAGNVQPPLRDGEYVFRHMYAEAEHYRIKSIEVLVKISGNHVVVINNTCSDVFPIGVLEEGTLIWHSESRQWIIGTAPSDIDAEEVGGCTDGPTVIDLQNRIYWTC